MKSAAVSGQMLLPAPRRRPTRPGILAAKGKISGSTGIRRSLPSRQGCQWASDQKSHRSSPSPDTGCPDSGVTFCLRLGEPNRPLPSPDPPILPFRPPIESRFLVLDSSSHEVFPIPLAPPVSAVDPVGCVPTRPGSFLSSPFPECPCDLSWLGSPNHSPARLFSPPVSRRSVVALASSLCLELPTRSTASSPANPRRRSLSSPVPASVPHSPRRRSASLATATQ